MSSLIPPVPRQKQYGNADLPALLQRAQYLKLHPQEQRHPEELDNINKLIAMLANQNRLQPLPVNGNHITPQHLAFSDIQVETLKAQVAAFKHIRNNTPIPEETLRSIRLPPEELAGLDLPPASPHITPAVNGTLPEPETHTKEEPSDTTTQHYNAYRHPLTLLQQPAGVDPAAFAARIRHLVVPTLVPSGIDVQQILNERDRFVRKRMEQRIRELEPQETSENNQPTPTLDVQSAIELKKLKLAEKQKALRASLVTHLNRHVVLPFDRPDMHKRIKPTILTARQTEMAEKSQRREREARAKSKQVEQLNIVIAHGKNLVATNRSARDRVSRLGRSVLSFHVQAEKEEQKRIERISKERLKALKADDEEAYMKLIDTAKDTRITHLLRQTDSYLDSLAQAVAAQQRAGGLYNIQVDEMAATNEATFGAQVAADDEVTDKSKVDYYAVAHRITERITRQPSLLIGGTLKEYQIKGLQWMVSLYNNKLNGILADEMGLGKTIQTISLITFLIEVKNQRGPYLVIVPLSTMTNWSSEFAKWAPAVKLVAYKGNPAQRRDMQNELRMGQFQVLLTTYEYIIKDRQVLCRMKWVHMIIDEGHRMKNTQSKLAQTLTQHYTSRYRLILTGTPLQNNLPELWSLLNFVLPKIFNSVKSFDEWFNTPFANSGTADKIELNEEEALLIIRRLHKVLRPFLLRRLKKDVERELPDKVEKVIRVRMSALQSQLYKQMKKHKMIADGKDKGKGNANAGVKGLSNELMQLRKICQHPFLFESVEDKVNPTGMIDDKLVRTSGKIELLSRILPKFFACNHRVLIFFQMTKVMDIMEDFLKLMGWAYLRLDGGTKTEERASFVQLFNARDSEYKVFILSTRAGGLGLNLQTADTVIIFDSDWNPHADLQAQDRAHRIGQTKAVLILRFITEKSVEEAMYSRARFKLDIDDKVIQAGRFDNKSTQEEQEEFLRSILEADQEEENEEAGDMNDDELNAIIKRSDEEEIIFREMDMQRERETLERWRAAGNRGKPPQTLVQLDELPECYQNDEPFVSKEVEEVFVGRGARRRNVVSYNDGLDDDTWAMALEDGEDLEDIQARTRRTRASRIQDVDSPSASGYENEKPGRRGRKAKGKANVADYKPAASKRKRGNAASAASSMLDGDDDEDRDQKRRKTRGPELSAAIRDKMKRAFAECHRAVLQCEDETGRKRCELFRDLPDEREYPSYYSQITNPIALTQLRKRATSNFYKSVQDFRQDFHLMFNNARTFNQEGSWVHVDATEMEMVFEATFERVMTGSGLPGAPGDGPGEAAVDDDERPIVTKRISRRQVVSDDEYLTSDDE